MNHQSSSISNNSKDPIVLQVCIDISDIVRVAGFANAQTMLDSILRSLIPIQQNESKPSKKTKIVKNRPAFAVYLYNDELHSYEYVSLMAKRILGINQEESWALATQVSASGNGGKIIFFRGSRKECRNKRNQIATFGTDKDADKVTGKVGGSMRATVSRKAVTE